MPPVRPRAMNEDRFHRIEDLFHQARVLEPAERASFLDRECGAALELRGEVESLLAHSSAGTSHARLPDTFVEAQQVIVDRGPPSEGPGTRIGSYKILQQIGEGGFGVVYMAEQLEPVRRKVALKIIKLGMDTRQVIARFEVERQALALMDHPNIARVLDAGATETGRPYFVMELVRGIPITEYCDSRRLPARKRLDLFMQVCSAIQHAHQKGIIHRDIKPSNVLVTLHDDTPVPKVIDFGIAKATSHRLTERTLFTEFRQLIGTPEYMSPDQADISGLDVDTRTDIYSLGVLLYVLLTGTTPFDPAVLRSGGHAEVQRIIRDVEPPIPSTRIHTLATRRSGPKDGSGSKSSLEEIARLRRIEPGALGRLLRGDLDWIIMKAIEKDRTRRYQNASDLAADVRRYLGNEPVLAGPPRPLYKLRKFVRRHRVGVLAGLLVAFAMIGGLTLATIGFVGANREARRSQAVSSFLQSLLDLETAGAAPVSVDEVIASGRQLFGNDHAVIGTLLMSRASSLSTAGRLDEAIDAQREALGFLRRAYQGDHASVAQALRKLGELHEQHNDPAEAEAAYREALAMSLAIHGESSSHTAELLDRLAGLLATSGGEARAQEIKELWTRTVHAYGAALGADHRTTVTKLCKFATWLHERGYNDEARPLLEEGVARARRVLGDRDHTLFWALNALGQHRIYQQQDPIATLPLVLELVEMSTELWGPKEPMTLALQAQVAWFHQMAGDQEAAGRSLTAYLDARRESAARPSIGFAMAEQQILNAMKDWIDQNPDQGRELLLYLLADAGTLVGAESAQMSALLELVGVWMAEHGFDADAESPLQLRLEFLRTKEPERTAALAESLIHLGMVKTRQGQTAEGEVLLRECLKIREGLYSAGDWRVASALGASLAAQERFEDAEPLLLAGHDGLRRSPDAPDKRKVESRQRLAELYDRWARPDDASRFRDDSPD